MMTFPRQRVAVLSTVVATLIVVACDTGDPIDPGTGNEVWRVAPRTAVLRAINATLRLATVDPLGNPTLVTGISRRVIEPGIVQVDETGRVTASAPGTARVVVETDTRADTATIEVRQDVTTVTVAPSTASLAVGETRQLSSELRDANGFAVVGRAVSWASSANGVASVSNNGLVTAHAAGAATITASSEGRSATSVVAVTATGSAPALFVDDFESGNLNDFGRWHDIVGSGFAIVTASNEGITAANGTKVLKFAPAGTALSHFVATGATSPHERLYLSFQMYRPSSWDAVNNQVRAGGIRGSVTQWGSYGVGWGSTASCPGEPNNQHGQEFMFAYVFQDPARWALRTYTNWLGTRKLTENPPTCGGGYAIGAGNLPEATYHDVNFAPTANAWHRYEIEVRLNDVGQANGWQRIWVDGVLKIEHLNVTYRTTAGFKLWAVTFDTATINGSAFYIDDVVVRSSRAP
jgi:hypothetical protein